MNQPDPSLPSAATMSTERARAIKLLEHHARADGSFASLLGGRRDGKPSAFEDACLLGATALAALDRLEKERDELLDEMCYGAAHWMPRMETAHLLARHGRYVVHGDESFEPVKKEAPRV
jgi:hypothetical protein